MSTFITTTGPRSTAQWAATLARAVGARKQALDPQGLLCSDWWRHIQAQLSLTVAA